MINRKNNSLTQFNLQTRKKLVNILLTIQLSKFQPLIREPAFQFSIAHPAVRYIATYHVSGWACPAKTQ